MWSLHEKFFDPKKHALAEEDPVPEQHASFSKEGVVGVDYVDITEATSAFHETPDLHTTQVRKKDLSELKCKLTAIPLPKDDDIQPIFDDVDRTSDGQLTMKEVEKAIIQLTGG